MAMAEQLDLFGADEHPPQARPVLVDVPQLHPIDHGHGDPAGAVGSRRRPVDAYCSRPAEIDCGGGEGGLGPVVLTRLALWAPTQGTGWVWLRWADGQIELVSFARSRRCPGAYMLQW